MRVTGGSAVDRPSAQPRTNDEGSGLAIRSRFSEWARIDLSRPLRPAPTRVALENRQQPRSEMGIFFNIGV
jgi:hypothetical protein